MRQKTRPAERNRLRNAASFAQRVAKLTGKAEDNLLRLRLAAIQAAYGSTESGDGCPAAEPIALHQQHGQAGACGRYRRCDSGGPATHNTNIGRRDHWHREGRYVKAVGAAQADTSSSARRFVLGPKAATTAATPIIAAAMKTKTRNGPRAKSAPMTMVESTALNRLQL